MNDQQKIAEILDIMFKWFGRMYLSNATAQQRAQIVQYVPYAQGGSENQYYAGINNTFYTKDENGKWQTVPE